MFAKGSEETASPHLRCPDRDRRHSGTDLAAAVPAGGNTTLDVTSALDSMESIGFCDYRHSGHGLDLEASTPPSCALLHFLGDHPSTKPIPRDGICLKLCHFS